MDSIEDLRKFQYNSLHKIILGLTQIGLTEYLQLNTAEIDVCCSARRSPLIWVVITGNKASVQTLLKFGG